MEVTSPGDAARDGGLDEGGREEATKSDLGSPVGTVDDSGGGGGSFNNQGDTGVRCMCGMQAAPSGYLYECVSMPPAAESSSSVAQRGHRVMTDDAGIAADDIGGGGG